MESNLRGRRFSGEGISLYKELELEKGATHEEIKKSYRRLALRYHPDKNPGDLSASEKFKELNKANRILSDPQKKRIYDQYGSLGLHIAENFGEENVKYYFLLSSWWCKTLSVLCFCFTGCCCCCCLCCCFNCCCGRCAPKVDEDQPDLADLEREMAAAADKNDDENHTDGPTVNQPTSNSSTPIVLGEPTSSSPTFPTERTELKSPDDLPPSYNSLS